LTVERLPGDRDPKPVWLWSAWYDVIDAGSVAPCYPPRTEFLYSARSMREYSEIAEMFTDLYPDAAVPKNSVRFQASPNQTVALACGSHLGALLRVRLWPP
jgi:hypothetical protein